MKVAEHVLALYLLGDQAELTEAPLSISLVLEVSQRHLKHTTLQTLGRDLWVGGRGC